MKSEIRTDKVSLLRCLLLFLPLALLTFCQNVSEIVIVDNTTVLFKDSKVISLMKESIEENTSAKSVSINEAGQCVEYKYPIAFYVYYSSSTSIETVVINSDEELSDFFDRLTGTDQMNIDFPVELLSSDGLETTVINDLIELEGILEIALDACREGEDGNSVEYEFCDANQKKVKICHNGNTICISINAIWGHLENHEGDYLGTCN